MGTGTGTGTGTRARGHAGAEADTDAHADADVLVQNNNKQTQDTNKQTQTHLDDVPTVLVDDSHHLVKELIQHIRQNLSPVALGREALGEHREPRRVSKQNRTLVDLAVGEVAETFVECVCVCGVGGGGM
jgi:hypothetical protein